MDVEKEITDLREDVLRLQAALIVRECEARASRIALETILSRLSEELLDDLPFDLWWPKKQGELIDQMLIECPNGQLAAEIQRLLQEIGIRPKNQEDAP